MNRRLAEHLEQERNAIVADIRAAFAGVPREAGISWSEAQALDDYEIEEGRAAARARDTEGWWEERIDDADWDPDSRGGGFSFLDAIGYRYYIAPAMIQFLRGALIDSLVFHLTICNEYGKGQVALIDVMQGRAIARFIRYAQATCEGSIADYERGEWQRAHDSYWHTFETE